MGVAVEGLGKCSAEQFCKIVQVVLNVEQSVLCLGNCSFHFFLLQLVNASRDSRAEKTKG